jgi:hypothetical protein
MGLFLLVKIWTRLDERGRGVDIKKGAVKYFADGSGGSNA